MAYSTTGLRRMTEGVINIWALQTVDSVATAVGAGYVTDGGATGVLPGKGMQVGDAVLIMVVGAVPASGEAPATCTDQAWAYVSSINTTTGAASLTLTHTNS